MDYLETVERRFANPEIGDSIARLCQDGSSRQPKFILPSIKDRLARGASVDGLALETALWCRYCYGESDSGAPIKVDDPVAERLVRTAREARHRPAAFLEGNAQFDGLAASEVFRRAFTRALDSLWQNGVAATLRGFVTPG